MTKIKKIILKYKVSTVLIIAISIILNINYSNCEKESEVIVNRLRDVKFFMRLDKEYFAGQFDRTFSYYLGESVTRDNIDRLEKVLTSLNSIYQLDKRYIKETYEIKNLLTLTKNILSKNYDKFSAIGFDNMYNSTDNEPIVDDITYIVKHYDFINQEYSKYAIGYMEAKYSQVNNIYPYTKKAKIEREGLRYINDKYKQFLSSFSEEEMNEYVYLLSKYN